MANLKDIKTRISSVTSTQQITSAMKMVSAARFRKAEEAITNNRPYSDKMLDVLTSLALRTKEEAHPLLERREPKKVGLVLFTSDRGLCGSFNGSILRSVDRFLNEKAASYESISLYIVGKKGLEYYKKRPVEKFGQMTELFGNVTYGQAHEIGEDISTRYAEGELDLVYMVYNEFRSALTQVVVYDRLLPVEPPKVDPDTVTTEYIYEPDEEHMLNWVLPRYVDVRIYRAFLESTASEHGARMTAMESATTNASEMIDRLTLQYNRARQESITSELMDIVNGVESMK
ncbi:MAG: ATP synthase F1 subunit gamma [Deltaproteobacteria bacterium]|nr:MAG: ATP synthase F1 subunit gamma [Deltaproteobacteria bacterium]